MKHKVISRRLACCLLLLSFAVYSDEAVAQKTDAYSQCNSSIAQCQEDNEMLMASEIARRILEQRKYISYGALNRGQPACGGPRGEAYSSNSECLGHAANPYRRGCSKYYRCRSDT